MIARIAPDEVTQLPPAQVARPHGPPPASLKPTKVPSKTDAIRLSSVAAATGAASVQAAAPAQPKPKKQHFSLWEGGLSFGKGIVKGIVKSVISPITFMSKSWKNLGIGVGTLVVGGLAIATLPVAPVLIGAGVVIGVGLALKDGWKALHAKSAQQKYHDLEGAGAGIGIAADAAAPVALSLLGPAIIGSLGSGAANAGDAAAGADDVADAAADAPKGSAAKLPPDTPSSSSARSTPGSASEDEEPFGHLPDPTRIDDEGEPAQPIYQFDPLDDPPADGGRERALLEQIDPSVQALRGEELRQTLAGIAGRLGFDDATAVWRVARMIDPDFYPQPP